MPVNSQGTTLSIGVVPTLIAGLVSYSGFDGESTEIDTTTLSSTAKEFEIGLEDFGNFGVELLSDLADPGQAAMNQAKTDRTLDEYILTFSDLSTATWSGYVKSFTQTGAVDDVDKSSATIRISGTVVFAAAP